MIPQLTKYLPTIDEFIESWSQGRAAFIITLDREASVTLNGQTQISPPGTELIGFEDPTGRIHVPGVGYLTKDEVDSIDPLGKKSVAQLRTQKQRRESTQFALAAGIDINRLDPISEDEKPMGWWGEVNESMRFASGMSAAKDFDAMLKAGGNVGITIMEISEKSVPKLAQSLAKNQSTYLFVDSGAFSVFQADLKAKQSGQMGFDDILDEFPEGGKTLDFRRVLIRYEALAMAISKADDNGCGNANDRVFFVMPDVVGNQAESLELIKRYREEIETFNLNAIIPLQSGELTLSQAYEQMVRNLGYDPDTYISPIIGIPSKVEAASNEEFRELIEKWGDKIYAIHILGAAQDKVLQPRLDVLRETGYDGNVSADANLLRSFLYGSTDRAEAMRKAQQIVLKGENIPITPPTSSNQIEEEHTPSRQRKLHL